MSLHLETGIIFAFLTALCLLQSSRPREGVGSWDARARAGICLAAFASLSAVFGFFLFKVSPLLGLELAAGVALSLLHPANALCFLVHLLFLKPWEIAPEAALLGALPRLMLAVCAVSWLLKPRRPAQAPDAAWALLTLAGFSVWLFITTFQAEKVAQAQADWFSLYFRSPVVLGLCLLFLVDEHSVKQFQATLWLSALGVVLLGFHEFLLAGPPDGAGHSGGEAAERLRSVGGLTNSNDTAAIAVMALPLVALGLFRPGSGRAARLAALGASAALTAAVWYARSRGALLAMFAQAFGVRLFDSLRGGRPESLALAGLIALGGIGAAAVVPRDSGDMEMSTENRIVYLKAAVHMLVRNPVSGVGFGQYPVNYESHSPFPKHEWGLRTAHSTWFLVFAEAGLIGGALFTAFFALVARMAWRNRARRPEQLYSLVGYGVAMSFLSHAYLIYPYLLYGLIMASASVKERAEVASCA